MRYRKEKVDDWLWGDLESVKKRLKEIKNGKRFKGSNSGNQMCPFCGDYCGVGGNYTEEDMHIYPCTDCKEAMSYGYITEILKMKTN